MTDKEYLEYKRILYDHGKYDMEDVVNDSFPKAKAQRLMMRQKAIEFENKYGSAHSHLIKNGRDYAQYCMIVNG